MSRRLIRLLDEHFVNVDHIASIKIINNTYHWQNQITLISQSGQKYYGNTNDKIDISYPTEEQCMRDFNRIMEEIEQKSDN